MALFAPKIQDKTLGQTPTFISKGTEITGDIICEGNILINGYFRGKITSQSEIIIDIDGEIEGEIKAKKLLVSGIFKGNFLGEVIEIMSTGKVSGGVEAFNLIIEDNGIFEGTSKVITQEFFKNSIAEDIKIIDAEEIDFSFEGSENINSDNIFPK